MKALYKAWKAVFNFVVGDWILLLGTGLSLLAVVALQTQAVAPGWVSAAFVAGLVLSLTLTLRREKK